MLAIPTTFERADGWTRGAPEVFYKPEVAETLGAPLVQYHSLQQFFIDELQMPTDFDIAILLYGTRGPIMDRLYPNVLGSHHVLLGSHKMWINTVKAERTNDYRIQTMGVVAHEGRHMSDRVNMPFRTLGELTLGAREKYERRARAQQAHESLLRHLGDISYPNAQETLQISRQ
jgi:hypothetical protein